jgi:deoxyhypusine synthase
MSTSGPPTSATDSVLVASGPVPEGAQEVRGVNFDKFQGRDITVAEMVENMTHMGFQGSAVAEAARIINEMVRYTPLSRPLVRISKLIAPLFSIARLLSS